MTIRNIKISNWKGGENRWDNPTSLPVEESLAVRNQEYKTSGVLEPRPGFSRYNLCADNEILGIREFKYHGKTFYIVIDKSGEVNLFDPDTPSLTSLETGLSTLSNLPWNFATLNDCPLIMSNGIDRPLLYDGDAIRTVGVTEFPIFSGTALANTGAAAVNYSVKVSFFDEDTEYETDVGNATNVVQSNRDSPSLLLNLTSQIISPPSRFTHYRIYRTRGDGELFFYEKQVVISTTSVALTARDDELQYLAPEDNAPMPSMPYVVNSLGLIWCAGNVTYEEGTVTVTNGDTTITGSSTGWTTADIGKYIVVDGDEAHKYIIYDVDIANQIIRIKPLYLGTGGSGKSYKIIPERWRAYHCGKNAMGLPLVENWNSKYFVEVKYDENDGCTGLGDMEGSLAVLTDRSIYRISPSNDGMFIAEKTPCPTGTCSHRSIAKDGSGNLFFLSKHQLGVWKFGTDAPKGKNIGLPIRARLAELDQDKLQYAHAIYTDENYYLWVDDICYVYDNHMECWLEEEGIQASSASLIGKLRLVGDEYGYLYKSGTGTNDGANLLIAGERTGTVTAGGNTTLTDTGNWSTIDECKGLWVNIITGTAKGQRRKIASNTVNQLTVTEAWTTNPVAGDTYAIGAIRFRRRFGWFTLGDPIRTWTLAIHQEPQASGTMSLKVYKGYTTTAEEFTESIDLTKAIDSVKLSIKGATMAFDLEQETVDTEFKIYALILAMNQIENQTLEGSQTQEAQDGNR